ncbi:hypothetical protein BG011_010002 [Mortierella polycephala]|uniref:Nuclear speckle splicing regulatory protein 1 N-terminal domain-containing protein n=1 Tax=Mortierella polycephala TaxID=41804 RepID=A0A9P6U7K8_9FUNG|nr:hypothetical protein BG011_010002 [Mortierella polycephala]
MSGLQFGLNIKKKGPILAKPRSTAPASRPLGGRSAFGDHSSDDDNLDDDDDDDGRGGRHNSSSTTQKPKPISSTSAVNKTLRPYATATLQSTAVIEQQNAALAQDATVFDYDGVYDQLKSADRARELARKQDSADRRPKYVHALRAAAEARKRDQQIAEERKIEREREKEGEEFKDKEQFITPAYKAQKEAMRLADEEERKREEAVAQDKDGSLMQGFYRTLLDERTRLRPSGELLDAGALSKQGGSGTLSGLDTQALEALEKEKRSKDEGTRRRIIEAQEQGLKVVLNDEGQVVDKRELLKGGLNIKMKPATATSTSSSSRSGRDHHRSSYDRERAYRDYKDAKYKSSSHGRDGVEDQGKDQRSRMTEQIEQQLMEQEKKQEEEEKARQDSIREALKRKNQDDQVMDAKARYLARKAAAAAETKKGS